MTRLLLFFMVFCSLCGPARAENKWIITAGAGADWPENCLISLAVALERGADTVRLAVSMDGDDRVVLLADPVLTTGTDISQRFPDKIREDGTAYSFDLILAELRQLTVMPGQTSAEPHRESRHGLSGCSIVPLAEALELITLLEHEQDRSIGVVIELRKPWLHQKEGRDLAGAVLKTLSDYHFRGLKTAARIHLASYDADELRRIATELLPGFGPAVGIIQLIDHNDGSETMRFELGRWQPYSYDWLFTKFGLRSISFYTDALGLPATTLIADDGSTNENYLEAVRLLDLAMLAYPIDPLLDQPPSFAADQEAVVKHLLFSVDLDGLMTGYYQSIAAIPDLQQSPEETDAEERRAVDRLIENLQRTDPDLLFPTGPPPLR